MFKKLSPVVLPFALIWAGLACVTVCGMFILAPASFRGDVGLWVIYGVAIPGAALLVYLAADLAWSVATWMRARRVTR